MGSGSRAYPELAQHVGRIVAELGCHLLTGGGGGVMEEASRAFCATIPREGTCIGILKGQTVSSTQSGQLFLSHNPSRPNRWVELPIHTHLPLSGLHGRDEGSRNHINVLSSDVLIVLPGGSGTYSEITLRIDYGKKVIIFLGGYNIDGHSAEHFLSIAQDNAQVSIASSPEELEILLRQELGEGFTVCPGAEPGKINSDDPLSKSFVFPSITGKNILIVGVGGGCDIISAFALAELLKSCSPAKLVYANTKTRIRDDLEHISAHILRVPQKRITLSPQMHTHRTTLIDQSLPRGDEGCPLILKLPKDEDRCAELVAELHGMSFDMVLSVDTGADSIVVEATSGPQGRDQRMMKLLASLGWPWFHIAVSPGCDGETSFSQLQETVRKLNSANRYLGCFSIEPMLPVMRELAAPLKRKRTPNIIVDACSGALDMSSDGQSLIVPRGLRPEIPKRWLSVALVIGVDTIKTQQEDEN